MRCVELLLGSSVVNEGARTAIHDVVRNILAEVLPAAVPSLAVYYLLQLTSEERNPPPVPLFDVVDDQGVSCLKYGPRAIPSQPAPTKAGIVQGNFVCRDFRVSREGQYQVLLLAPSGEQLGAFQFGVRLVDPTLLPPHGPPRQMM